MFLQRLLEGIAVRMADPVEVTKYDDFGWYSVSRVVRVDVFGAPPAGSEKKILEIYLYEQQTRGDRGIADGRPDGVTIMGIRAMTSAILELKSGTIHIEDIPRNEIDESGLRVESR